MSFQINNLSLITYGAIGITSIALAVITIFDGESSPAGTDSADMLKSFMAEPSVEEESVQEKPEEVVESSMTESAVVQPSITESAVVDPSITESAVEEESVQEKPEEVVEPSAPPFEEVGEPSVPRQEESSTTGGKKSKKTKKSRRSKPKQTKHRR